MTAAAATDGARRPTKPAEASAPTDRRLGAEVAAHVTFADQAAALARSGRLQLRGGMIRQALATLGIVRCPCCLRGDLVVDLDRQQVYCSRRCVSDVCSSPAEHVAYCARRLTGGLRDAGAALEALCRASKEPVPLDVIYTAACGLPTGPVRAAILSVAAQAIRRANWREEVARREAEAPKEMAA